jgi:hypothetical protein
VMCFVALATAPGAVIGLSAFALPPISASPPEPVSLAGIIHLEAENAELTGASVATSRRGYSGAGYVTGLRNEGDKMMWSLPQAQTGIYEVRIRYSAPSGEKGYDLVVNGFRSSGMLPATADAFATHIAGKVELKDGPNTMALEKGWGYYDIDAIDLVPATIDMALQNRRRFWSIRRQRLKLVN